MTRAIEGRYDAEWPGPPKPRECRVVAIGDSSLTAEGLDDPTQLWLHRALESIHLQTGLGLHLVVRGQPGAGLTDVERLARLVAEEEPDVVVVVVGTNDARHFFGLVGRLTDYTSRYRNMVREVADAGALVVVTGVGNLRYIPWSTKKLHHRLARAPLAAVSWYVDRAIRRAVSGFADVEMIRPREIDRTMWAGRDRLYGADGFHPSAAGHDVWANLARPVLATAIARSGNRHHADTRALDADLERAPSEARVVTFVRTGQGVARVFDGTGNGVASVGGAHGGARAVVVIPDSPNVLEHHASSFRELGHDFRVIGLEMPGAGYTDLRTDERGHGGFDFSLKSGAAWIRDVLDRLGIDEAIVTASCVNGLYAATAANMYPERVRALVLCQTPSLPELKRWAKRTIPWPLRNRLLGDRVLGLSRRRFAGFWYGRSLGSSAAPDTRARFDDIARQGFRAGASWRLAPLILAILAEPDDPLDGLTVRTRVLWGDEDGTHRKAGTGPWSGPGSVIETSRVRTGHFPELEDPGTFATAVRATAAEVWPDG
jgi:pimeloyl-ACP methyl ester carboxylesterase/lysophospholipase L1-like esterase